MYTFIACVVFLVVGYFIYGKIVEKVFDIDGSVETPATKYDDGEDYIPMSKVKLFFLRYINIAGLGPIFGAIQGALFGPSAFLWIILGTIFAGAVHDFCSGFLSVRQDGLSIPGIIGKYLGSKVRHLLTILIVVTAVLVVATFTKGAATLLASLTSINGLMWIVIIFIYFFIAIILPVNKLVGKIYPIFGFFFILITFLLLGGLISSPVYTVPELTTKGLYYTPFPLFPFLFVTITCGAISGYHSTQSPLIARYVKDEKDMKPVFYGAMVLEGFTALVWAAIAMAFFKGNPQLALFLGRTPAIAVKEFSYVFLGKIGLILTVLCVAFCPIITGDTILRGARLAILDEFGVSGDQLLSRLKIITPLLVIAFVLTFVDFSIMWTFFAWVQISIASLILWTSTVYLIKRKRKYVLTLIPAMFCSVVSVAYILQAPGGFYIEPIIANTIAVIVTVALTAIFMKKFKFNKDVSSS